MRQRRIPLVLTAACAVAALGCGGGHAKPAAPQATPAQQTTTTTQPAGLDPAILPPKRVPQQATGPVDPAAKRVILRWLRALRRGEIARAASYFAIPSRFQNGTPVLTLDRRTEVLAVVVSFPCGAAATKFAAAGRFTLVRFRLTERKGGDCKGAAGNTTGGAIRVANGHIAEWYRLYDQEEVRPGAVEVDPGDQAA